MMAGARCWTGCADDSTDGREPASEGSRSGDDGEVRARLRGGSEARLDDFGCL